ncbi:hypothetical protein J3R83DRAFT_3711 [Lanmaoa asiatica]|nr:hypothetical protein J3R83DRAFT_3711 [Lanmaoa asiatica]
MIKQTMALPAARARHRLPFEREGLPVDEPEPVTSRSKAGTKYKSKVSPPPPVNTMPTSASLSLINFTAYELPTKKWMKLVRPKMRLRVRAQNHEFVSSTVKVCDQNPDEKNASEVNWLWDDDERFSRPSFANGEVFEVEVERQFLLWYKCIRRTKPATVYQVRIGDHCTLSLYDGEQSTGELEDRIEIGKITFTLRRV